MNPVEAILLLVGAAFSLMVCAAAITFGVIATCRFMNWVPVIAVSYTTITRTPQEIASE